MEKTLTECLIRVREDLDKLKKGREKSLEENPNSIRRLLEPITNTSILAVCSSQSTPEITALETLLDNFHYLVSTNKDPDVWTTFDHELSVICAKVLSAMERTDRFQVMFSKLLSVINEISKNSSDVWKAIARQLLNVFINVKFSPDYLEVVLKMYADILRNLDDLILYNFSMQNLELLKTFSLLVQGVGDFETQFAVMEIVFMHLLKQQNLMEGFFGTSEKDKAHLQSLKFEDFEEDCRLYLNALNRPGGGLERRVYSVSCHFLSLGGCIVEAFMGGKIIWVDANRETERVSFRCCNFDSKDQTVIYVTFSEITHVQINSGEVEEDCHVTLRTKKLRHLHRSIKNDEMCLVAENRKDATEFVSFLNVMIKRKKGKFSKTKPLFIDRSLFTGGEGLQVNAISSSARPETDLINLFGEPDSENIVQQTQIKTPPLSPQEWKVVLQTQDTGTVEVKRTLEETSKTIDFWPKKPLQRMSSQETFFDESFSFDFVKENQPPGKQKTYRRKAKSQRDNATKPGVLRDRKQFEASEDCFRLSVQQKKPSLPKLSRKKAESKGENKRTRKNRQGEVEQPKPSLLDPNGYAFQRWMQPTTSERSNFWLRKLHEESKQKLDVFEFSDSDSEIIIKRKKRVVHSKRRYRKQRYDSKRPTLKQATEFYRNKKQPSSKAKNPPPVASPEPDKFYGVLGNSPVWCKPQSVRNEAAQSNILFRRSSTSSESLSEDERLETQKRDRSEEENSLTRAHLKKKVKTKPLIPGTLFPSIRQRLKKAEDKARRQTNEIIATVNKATQQLLDHFQRRQESKTKLYLKAAKEASTRIEDDVRDVNQYFRRLQKLIVCFQTKCSISTIHQSVTNDFEKIKNDIRKTETTTGTEKKIGQVTERLKVVIEGGIERSMRNEMDSKRKQLVRCSTLLNSGFG